MKTITFARIDGRQIDPDTYKTLWQLSNCRNEEYCWSFLVRVDFIDQWLQDVATDAANGHPAPPTAATIENIRNECVAGGHLAVFVVNDYIYEVTP